MLVAFIFPQVYIVAMKQKNAPTAGAPASDEGAEPPGSLLELVAPELTPLSKFWLGALRDHALLSLSPELASQLPLQAGMFYRLVRRSILFRKAKEYSY